MARRTFNPRHGSSLRYNRRNMQFSVPSCTTIPLLWRPNQHGRHCCSAAGSSWEGLLSMRRRETALTPWRPGLISSGLKTGQLSGLWCVLNVITRPRRSATEQKQSRIRKVATLARSGEKGRALQPETPRQSQSQSRLFKRSRVSSRQTQNLSLLRRQLRQTFSCQKLPSSSPPHSARCHDSPGPLGVRAEHWYDFGALAGNSNLFVQVVAHIAAASVPHTVLEYLKADHATCQTHRRARTASHNVIST